MRGLIQRVAHAEVEIAGQIVGRIERGLLVYVGVAQADAPADAAWLARKVCDLRIFEDSSGKLNLSVRDINGGVLAVPNFTLLADARKGRRPAFVAAAAPDIAKPLFETFVSSIHQAGCPVADGVFGQHMVIRGAAEGPVNVIIDTPRAGEMGQEPSDVS